MRNTYGNIDRERVEHRRDRTDAGYTLIEMILVVLILGIMASVVVIAVGGMRTDAAETACSTDRRQLAVAVEAYLAEHGAPIAATGVGPDRFERTLVDAELLRSPSDLHDLAADGTINPEGTSSC